MGKQAILLASYGNSLEVMAETVNMLANDLAELYKIPVYHCCFAEKYLKAQPNLSVKVQIDRLKTNGIQEIQAVLCFLSKGSTAFKMKENICQFGGEFSSVSFYGPILESEDLISQLPRVLSSAFRFTPGDQALSVGHGSKTPSDQDYQKVQRAFTDSGYADVHVALIRSMHGEISEIKLDKSKPVRLIPFLLGCGAHAKHEIFGESNSIHDKLIRKGFTVINEPTGLLELSVFRSLLTKVIFNVRREEK